MDKRFFLFLILVLLGLQLYLQLVAPPEAQRPPRRAAPEAESQVAASAPTSPELVAAPAPVSAEAREDFGPPQTITVETGVCRVVFTTLGARPQEWVITDPTYSHIGRETAEARRRGENGEAPEIIPNVPPATGLVLEELPLEVHLSSWPHESFNRVTWRAEGPTRDETTGAIHLAFESPEIGGLVLRKEFTFYDPVRTRGGEEALRDHAEGYLSEMRLVLRNTGDQKVVLSDEAVGLRLTWGPGIGNFEPTGFYNQRYPIALVDGEMWYRAPTKDRPRGVSARSPEGVTWAGLQSRYFMAAIIPAGEHRPVVTKAEASLRPANIPRDQERWGNYSPLQTIALAHGPVILDPGQEQVQTYDLYVGPKHRAHLLAAGHDLQRADYYSSWNWMRALCIGLTHLLNAFHRLVGNYGVAILLLTVLVRLLLYPLTHHQMKIMAKTQREMARIKPLLDEVREKYKGDMARIQRETMAIYREHGVNPFAGLKGCLPLLLQMPIFIALWKMLYSSIELRGAPFLWIRDLSAPDALIHAPWLEQLPLLGGFLGPSINLLPILMALTQWLTMKIGAVKIDDPNQRAMMTFMPIMLTVMLFRAPSGLMIYWVAGNIWQMGHQYLTTRTVQRHAAEEAPAAPAAAPSKARAVRPGGRKTLAASLAEKRREAAKARQRAIAESSSLPRWIRRGGR